MTLIRLYKNQNGLISSAIRWQTRGIYSHSAIIVDGVLYEASEFKGVHNKIADKRNDRYFDDYQIILSEQQEEDLIRFLDRQLGKPYDYTMVLRFITRQQEDRKSVGKWFCSELVFAAVQKVGVNLLNNVEPWEISPVLLSFSPLLQKIV
jgi:uncharacterized protein YycO